VKEVEVNDENRADFNQALTAACAQKGVEKKRKPVILGPSDLKQALVVSRKRRSPRVRIALRSTPVKSLDRSAWVCCARGVVMRAVKRHVVDRLRGKSIFARKG
jgi:hypothetical protein